MKRSLNGHLSTVLFLLSLAGFANDVGAQDDVKAIVERGGNPPTLKQDVKPRYTREAMDAQIQGTVLMTAVVQPDGSVGTVKVVRSLDAGLDQEAITAMKQWKFSPAMKDGKAVAVLVHVEMAFKLADQPVIDPQLSADIETLMDVTHAREAGLQIASALSASALEEIRKESPAVPDRAIVVIKDVVDSETAKMFQGPNGLNAQLGALYAKYLTRDDIRALIAFYNSDTGKKAIAVMPAIINESMAIGETWGRANGARLLEVLRARLKSEGLIQ